AQRDPHPFPTRPLPISALKGRSKDEWVEIFNAGKVSCGPINTMVDLEHDPQVVARNVIVPLQHPVKGEIRTAASPMQFSASPVRSEEHTSELQSRENLV